MPVFSNFSSSSAQGFGELRTINKSWVDNFQRAATISGLGNSFDGQPWIASKGNWFINTSGQAQSTANYSIASTYMGTPNVTQITMSGMSNGTGIVFWQTDANNWWAATLTANSGTFTTSYSGTTYNPCLTNNPGGTNDFTGTAGYCGNYACGGGTVYVPDSNNCSYNVSAVPCTPTYSYCCTQYVGYFSAGQAGQRCSAYGTCQTGCTGGIPAHTACCTSCGNAYSYSYTVYCDYFFDSNGNATCTNQQTCASGSSNVCGFKCIGGSTFSPVNSTVATNFYQLNIIESVAGVVSTITSGILTNATVGSSGNQSATSSGIYSFTVPSGYLAVVGSGLTVTSGLNSLTFAMTGSNSYTVLNSNYGITTSGTWINIVSTLSSGQTITVSGGTLGTTWGKSIDSYGDSTISGTLLNGTVTINGQGNSFTVSGTAVSSSPVLPLSLSVITSGGVVNSYIYANSNTTNLLTQITTSAASGSGSTGDFIGIINVPTSTLSGATTVGSFTGIV